MAKGGRTSQEEATVMAAIVVLSLAIGLSTWIQPPLAPTPIPATANAVGREASVVGHDSPPTEPSAGASTAAPAAAATAAAAAVEETSASTATTTVGTTPTTAATSSPSPTSTTTSTTTTTTTTETTPSKVDPMAIFRIFSKHSFDWEASSTPTPITTVTTVAKKMLGYKPEDLPEDLRALLSDTEGVQDSYRHTVPIASARKYLAPRILEDIKALCDAGVECDFNVRDPEFGTTPLHWAQWYGEQDIVDYLLSRGADANVVDFVGRKPANLTFANFVSNSRRWAREAGRGCEVPEVVLPVLPGSEDSSDSAAASTAASSEAAIRHAEREVRRLISEGEPVLIRNVVPWLKARLGLKPTVATAEDFVAAWGHLPAKVAGIPYADNFNVSSTPMSIREYFQAHMAASEEGVAEDEDPLYVFKGDDDASAEGERLMSAFINAVFPVTPSGDAQSGGEASGNGVALLCRTDSPGLGVNNVQFYLGNTHSGAPFHIHSDAANLLMRGEKVWWVMPPRNATFSRMHIRQWAAAVGELGRKTRDGAQEGASESAADESETKKAVSEGELPLRCTQRSGDMMYVPFDWGHAALNTADMTFGYTTELVNRRDALMFADGRPCGDMSALKKPKKVYVLSKTRLS